MNRAPEYKVAFGKIAWTVNYNDNLGAFTFTFECDIDEYKSTGKVRKLFLSKIPLKNMKVMEYKTPEENSHLKLMLDRVRDYLTSHGYEVAIV